MVLLDGLCAGGHGGRYLTGLKAEWTCWKQPLGFLSGLSNEVITWVLTPPSVRSTRLRAARVVGLCPMTSTRAARFAYKILRSTSVYPKGSWVAYRS